jgi:hypothetical protein
LLGTFFVPLLYVLAEGLKEKIFGKPGRKVVPTAEPAHVGAHH